jgi:hypothetical protein
MRHEFTNACRVNISEFLQRVLDVVSELVAEILEDIAVGDVLQDDAGVDVAVISVVRGAIEMRGKDRPCKRLVLLLNRL